MVIIYERLTFTATVTAVKSIHQVIPFTGKTDNFTGKFKETKQDDSLIRNKGCKKLVHSNKGIDKNSHHEHIQ